jgi:predicted RNA-binding Zn-ribbon protein involved in translation (DUF1610 family)
MEKKTIKVVDNGNPFGLDNAKSWFTFYCNKCGIQVLARAKECESTNPFSKGCGTELNWEELEK